MKARSAAIAESAHNGKLHPAAEWALAADFDPLQVDCTTTVVLKILDNKCKMLPGEKVAVMAIYDAVRHRPATLLGKDVHDNISAARSQANDELMQTIHRLRVEAEAVIAKPQMKSYKAFLRNGLFG